MSHLFMILVFLVSVHRGNAGYGRRYRKVDQNYLAEDISYDNELTEPELCSFKKFKVQMTVKCPNGAGCSHAVVVLRDNTRMRKLLTDARGIVKTIVTGCDISVSVRTKDRQPVCKSIRLDQHTKGIEKIAIQLKPRCNLKVRFDDTDGEVVYYQYESYNGNTYGIRETGAGTALAKEIPLCIYWEKTVDSARSYLNMEIISSGVPDPMILHITRRERDIVVSIPPFIEDDYKFLICFLLWERNRNKNRDADIASFKLYGNSGETHAFDDIIEDEESCVWFTSYPTSDENLLATVTLEISENSDSEINNRHIDGNAYILDCDGKHLTVETPNDRYTNDYDDTEVWPFMCICAYAKTIKDIKVLNVEDYLDYEPSDNTLCNDVCPTENTGGG